MKSYFIITLLLFSVFFIQAQIVNIPDANFKNALVNTLCVDTNDDGIGDDDVDLNNDGEIQVSEAEATMWLNIPNQDIYSIEGIQSFVNITLLSCPYNQLTNVDLTQNPNLLAVFFMSNQLNNINLTQCSNITLIEVWFNELSNLDLTGNPNLLYLRCDSNQLTDLDLTENLNLERLSCSSNQLSSLDLSQNPNLISLSCGNNQLLNLNLKNENNSNLTKMYARGNPNLTCIQVDDVTATHLCFINNYTGWCKDDWAEYSEVCELGISDFDKNNVKIFPNPVQNILNINTEFPIEQIKIYTLQGQLINETTNNQIDVSLFSSGLYFASIVIDGKNIVKKFIKE
ncbi:MAG: hypothetical protein ACJA2M_003058 [Polaribacter sp.]|jgi:hypothetical protein